MFGFFNRERQAKWALIWFVKSLWHKAFEEPMETAGISYLEGETDSSYEAPL